MTQSIHLPAGAVQSRTSRPFIDFMPASSKGIPSASIITEPHQGGSFIDMCKVVAFLILAVIARSAFTSEYTGHVDGATEPPAHIESSEVIRSPDLMDLSTVGF